MQDDKLDERRKLVSVTQGMARAVKGEGAARICANCSLNIPTYPGRYPESCPSCGGKLLKARGSKKVYNESLSGVRVLKTATENGKTLPLLLRVEDFASRDETRLRLDVQEEFGQRLDGLTVETEGKGFAVYRASWTVWGLGEGLPVVAVSRVPRIQAVIEAGSYGNTVSEGCSRARIVSYAAVTESIPGGLKGLEMFLEGPIDGGRYFRVESTDGPVLVFEFNDPREKLRIFATSMPERFIGFDPRQEIVEDGLTEIACGGGMAPGQVGTTASIKGTTRKSVLSVRPQGQGAQRAMGRYRFELGHNRKVDPRIDIARSLQNRRNSKRGLAGRVQAAKDWHRSATGVSYHKDLARFNTGNHRGQPVGPGMREDVSGLRSVSPGVWEVWWHDKIVGTIYRRDGVITAEPSGSRKSLGPFYDLASAFRALRGERAESAIDESLYESLYESDDPEWALYEYGGMATAGVTIPLQGNLGIPRAAMPQVASGDLQHFLSWLREQKVHWVSSQVPVTMLKATQREMNPAKVQRLVSRAVDDPKTIEKLKKPILASIDHYVLDGHHRWAAMWNIDEHGLMPVILIQLPIRLLLKLMDEYPRVFHKEIDERTGRVAESKLDEFGSGGVGILPMQGGAYPEQRTLDDVLDSILRKLITIESQDILQDVEITQEGAIYFYFDPSTTEQEMAEVLNVMRQAEPKLELVGTPDGRLPTEQYPAQWWVFCRPANPQAMLTGPPAEDQQQEQPPSEKPGDDEAPKQQMVVQGKTTVDQIATDLDLDAAVQAIGESESDAMPHYESVRLDAERETAGSVRQEAYVGTKHVGRVQRARGRWIAVTEANDQLQGEFDSPEAAAGALARSISKADTRMQSSATETKITRASARRG